MLFGPAIHSDLQSGTLFSFSNTRELEPSLRPDPRPENCRILSRRHHGRWRVRVRGSSKSNGVAVEKSKDKRFSICTADELHFVKAPNSDWSLALWRYLPSPEVNYL